MPRLSATVWVISALCAALIALLIFGLSANKTDRSIEDAINKGERPTAPDAGRQLPVLGKPGKRSLSDYRGQVVVLNFWASWCKPCRAEAPVLERAHKALQATNSGTVLGSTFDDASDDSLAFARRYSLTYPSLRDVGTKLASEFGTRALPETFVLDRRGRIVAVSRGVVRTAFLDNAIARAKAG